MNDPILIRITINNDEKIHIGKLLQQVSIWELYNDLMGEHPTKWAEAYNKNGKRLISDTAFDLLMLPHVKMSNNAYRLILTRKFESKNY